MPVRRGIPRHEPSPYRAAAIVRAPHPDGVLARELPDGTIEIQARPRRFTPRTQRALAGAVALAGVAFVAIESTHGVPGAIAALFATAVIAASLVGLSARTSMAERRFVLRLHADDRVTARDDVFKLHRLRVIREISWPDPRYRVIALDPDGAAHTLAAGLAHDQATHVRGLLERTLDPRGDA